MSDTQYGELGDTLYFHFAANDTSGSGGDGASAAADVRLCGAASDAAPVYSTTPALLSHANYPAGCYEVGIAMTAGNGFSTGNTYAVFCTLAIDSQNPTGFIGRAALGKLATQQELGILLETTIDTVNSQTSFTLTAGSDVDNQYQSLLMVIQDADSANRMERVYASAYTGATLTVTLAAATTTFSIASGDKVLIYPQLHEAKIASVQADFIGAEVRRVNGVNIGGAGTEGDPFGPA